MLLAHRFAALCSLTLVGCLSGQTGSPDCVGATSCVCDTLYSAGTLLRVHAESAEGDRLVATVEEVIGSVYGSTDVRAGDRIGGEVTALRPCDPEQPVALEGADLFVLFYGGIHATSPNCAGRSDGECGRDRSEGLLNGGYSFVLPWDEELDFGAGHLLPRTEVGLLESPETCWERFPVGATPPCDDTVNCSLSQSADSASSPWMAFVVALGLMGLLRRGGRCLDARRPSAKIRRFARL